MQNLYANNPDPKFKVKEKTEPVIQDFQIPWESAQEFVSRAVKVTSLKICNPYQPLNISFRNGTVKL